MQAGESPILIVAHPGHELRLFNWMERTRPTVFVLTDGSGGNAQQRTSHSRQIVETAGAQQGSVFGVTPDRAWYDTILRGDATPFQNVVDAILAAALAQGAGLVVTDAVDGYNPMHDLCAAVGGAVVARLHRDGVATQHLVSRAVAGRGEEIAQELLLDHRALERKRAALETYAPLADEARRLLSEEPGALGVERLECPAFAWPDLWRPQWEEIGRGRVALSRYARPIEYAKHVLPLARALLSGAVGPELEETRTCAS